VFNIVNGRGDVVGAELSSNPDVAKVTFTGSTAVGRLIKRSAAETMKRVTLELGGKGPNVAVVSWILGWPVPERAPFSISSESIKLDSFS
jgi:aldehyde dehydrogenase (NAD+)